MQSEFVSWSFSKGGILIVSSSLFVVCYIQEYQSFTDLQFSKEKSITCIQWHPTIKGTEL